MKLEQHQKVQQYLNAVCSQIKCREVHGQIRLELLGHIEEIVEELRRENVSEEESIDRAIEKMGEALSLGQQLHQAHKPRTEWSLLALVGTFIGFGLLSLYAIEKGGLVRSISGNSLLFSDHATVSVFTNSLFWFSLGLIIAAGMYFFDYRKIKSCSWYLFWGILLVWLTVLLFGSEAGGRHMLNLFWIRIDFVMITPFLLTIALAGIFSQWDRHQEKGSLKVLFLLAPGKRRWKFKCRAGSLLKAFVLLVIPCIFYLESAVISGAVLYAAVFLLLMRASGAKLWRVFLVLLVSMPLIGYTFFDLFAHPYRFDRLTAFMHPYRDPQGAGYLYIRLKEAIHAAGLWGQGFTLPAGMIPSVHTDFILAYVVYTFGWICGLAVLALAITLIIRMNHVAGQARDPYGRLLVTGLAGIFAVQFFWNILMSLGLSPVFSLSLPFISYGGSQLIIQMAAMGLVLSVYRRKDMVVATEKA